MNRVAVSSSNVESVGHDGPSSVLEVRFHNGRTYRYFGVSASVFAGLLAAPSVGQYFNANVKGRYQFEEG
jgi:hypothetical protein